jgi:thiamine phosphate synthase YjbQ (UPF0047 family)
MPKKIRLKTYHSTVKATDRKGVIRITSEAEGVLRSLAIQTGLPLKAIASELIIQSAELVEIIDVGEDN